MLKRLPGTSRIYAAMLMLVAIVTAPSSASALELVFVHADWCPVCERWQDEVGEAYPKTEEAKIAPLRRIDYDGSGLDRLTLKKRVGTTPTFLLIDGNVEVGRIEGYTADHFFWGEIGELLKKFSAQNRE